MSNQRFTPEFKEEAVRQILDRGYTVAEVFVPAPWSRTRAHAACARGHPHSFVRERVEPWVRPESRA
jgi:hypothetical protein